jgi:PTH1 family peptidyl-tRNA hydrolase
MNYLIVGLGNIGSEYHETRHNIGFMVLDLIAHEYGLTFKLDRHANVCEWKFKGKNITLVKPTTYMNLSGKAVQYWMQAKKIPIENILIITDDLALPFSSIRLRAKGSHGGHNGLTHIEQVLQTSNYARMRMGIGNNYPKGQQADYVLSPFDKNEQPIVLPWITKAMEGCKSFVSIGVERTMNTINTK